MELVQQRDKRGHYTGDLKPDADLAAKWAEGEKRAAAAEKVCKRFGLPMSELGIRKLTTGVWRFGVESQPALWGLIAGLVRGRELKKREYLQTLLDLTEAAGVTDKFLDEARARLSKTRPA